jgi:hypothetical protein
LCIAEEFFCSHESSSRTPRGKIGPSEKTFEELKASSPFSHHMFSSSPTAANSSVEGLGFKQKDGIFRPKSSTTISAP